MPIDNLYYSEDLIKKIIVLSIELPTAQSCSLFQRINSTHLNLYAKCLCLQYILFSEKNIAFTFETSPVGAFGKMLRITNINSFKCMIKILRATFELKISFTSLVIL